MASMLFLFFYSLRTNWISLSPRACFPSFSESLNAKNEAKNSNELLWARAIYTSKYGGNQPIDYDIRTIYINKYKPLWVFKLVCASILVAFFSISFTASLNSSGPSFFSLLFCMHVKLVRVWPRTLSYLYIAYKMYKFRIYADSSPTTKTVVESALPQYLCVSVWYRK